MVGTLGTVSIPNVFNALLARMLFRTLFLMLRLSRGSSSKLHTNPFNMLSASRGEPTSNERSSWGFGRDSVSSLGKLRSRQPTDCERGRVRDANPKVPDEKCRSRSSRLIGQGSESDSHSFSESDSPAAPPFGHSEVRPDVGVVAGVVRLE